MKSLYAFVLFATIAASAAAGTEPADTALAVVEETSEQMLTALRENRATLERDQDLIYPLVDDILLPHFDFATMSRWVLGKSWRSATPDQRDRFTAEFRTFLVRAYAKALLVYSDERIRYLAGTPAKNNRVAVRTEIHSSGRPALPVNYGMRQSKDGRWQVYDVKVDGISLVTNYRNSFASQVRKGGVDELIARLSQRNRGDGP